jgi:hypothetical protein
MRQSLVSGREPFPHGRLDDFSSLVSFLRRRGVSDCPAAGRPTSKPGLASGGWQAAVVFDLGDAGEALDQLEAVGCADRDFRVVGDSAFEIRWRWPSHL